MRHEYVSLKSVLEDFVDVSDRNIEIDETLILKFASDAADRIVPPDSMVEKIALLEVENYHALLPDDFKFVIQAAYRLYPNAFNRRQLVEEISEYTQSLLDGTGCNLKVAVDCPKCKSPSCSCERPIIEVDANQIWKNANPQLYANYMSHFSGYGSLTQRGRSVYHPQFKLMNHTANSYFNVPYHVNECPNINADVDVEYSLDPPRIVVNFECGHILLAYFGIPLDEEGYRMIPNSPIVFQAIQFWIQERLGFRNYIQSPNQATRAFWTDMHQMKEIYVARAKSHLTQPSMDEFSQFVKSHWVKLIPTWEYESRTDRMGLQKFRLPGESYNLKDRRNGY
jgi:hypothetical protein